MRILPSGNVGVGTNNFSTVISSRELKVGSDTNCALVLGNTSTTVYGFMFGSSGSIDLGATNDLTFQTGGSYTSRGRFTAGGQFLVNGSTSSNGQGSFQNTGASYTSGLEIGGNTFSTSTTASPLYTFYFFNGGGGQTLTMPDTNGQSSFYVIKNYSASSLAIARTGSNVFIAAGATSTTTSLTLAAGASTILIGNGTTNYVQIL
jgi:hypothetical protein